MMRNNHDLRPKISRFGNKPLLSKDGGVEIAKEIEAARIHLDSLLFCVPMAVQELMLIAQSLVQGYTVLYETVNLNDENNELNMAESCALFMKNAKKVEASHKRLQKLKADKQAASKLDKAIETLGNNVYALKLKEDTLFILSDKVKDELNSIMKMENNFEALNISLKNAGVVLGY